MNTARVLLNEVSKLEEFVKITERCPIAVYATGSNPEDESVVNAKGMFGLLSINVKEPITVFTRKTDEDSERYFDSIAKFIV